VELPFNGYAIPYKVDIDNDGTEDLIALVYGGGTGGFSVWSYISLLTVSTY
jgi:hypothetical protein